MLINLLAYANMTYISYQCILMQRAELAPGIILTAKKDHVYINYCLFH